DLAGLGVQQALSHVPAQVSVGHDSNQLSFGIHDTETAEALLSHGHERRAHDLVLRGERQPVILVHDVGDELELRSQRAAGVEYLEVLSREALGLEERNGETVAKGE